MDELSPRREIKQGRRAGNIFQSSSTSTISDPSSTSISLPQNSNNSSPKPARRQSGWSDSADKKKGKNVRSDDEEVDERLKNDATVLLDTDIDDIPVIPDLDEIQKDDTTQQVSAPPNVQVTRVATYKELDHDFEKHAGLLILDGDIDLKLLGCVLSPEVDVFEEDKVWEWDRVFADVSSEFRNEWEKTKIISDKNDRD